MPTDDTRPDPEYHEHVAGDKHSHPYNGPHSHGGVSALYDTRPEYDACRDADCSWAAVPHWHEDGATYPLPPDAAEWTAHYLSGFTEPEAVQ